MITRIGYCKCGAAIYIEAPLKSWDGKPMLERYFNLENGIKKGEYITCCPGCGDLLNQNKMQGAY